MTTVLLALPLFLFFGAGFMAGAHHCRARLKWFKREARELEAQRDRVLRLLMQHLDAQPFARLVWDELISIPNHPPLEGKQ